MGSEMCIRDRSKLAGNGGILGGLVCSGDGVQERLPPGIPHERHEVTGRPIGIALGVGACDLVKRGCVPLSHPVGPWPDKLYRRGVKGRLWPREALISRRLPLGVVYQSNKVGGLGPRRERRPSPRAELHERCAGFTSPMRSPPWLRGTRWSRVNARPCVGGKFISIAPPHNQHTAKAGSRSSLRRQLVTFLRHEWEKA